MSEWVSVSSVSDEEVNDGRRWLLAAVSRETGPAGAVHGIQCKA